jgi:hypothetical protein
MRKRIISQTFHGPPAKQGWLDLENTALVEMTSEDNAFPIESALLRQGEQGWRAAEPGIRSPWSSPRTAPDLRNRRLQGARQSAFRTGMSWPSLVPMAACASSGKVIEQNRLWDMIVK